MGNPSVIAWLKEQQLLYAKKTRLNKTGFLLFYLKLKPYTEHLVPRSKENTQQ